MKEKVLLLNPPADSQYIRDFYCSFSSKANYYWPPQDLLLLSGILKEQFEVEVIDAIGSNLKEESCLRQIINSSAKALIFTTGTASFEKDIKFVERLKRERNIRVIGSSSMFRSTGREIMEKYPFLDALIVDFTDNDILNYLRGNNSGFRHLIYRRENRLHLPQEDKDGEFSVGIPLQESFTNHANRLPIFGNSPFAIVVGSTGCSFSCKFCVAGTMRLRKRILNEIIDELRCIIQLDINKIFFVDPLFTADKNRVFEFCEALKKGGIKIEWSCNAHPATLQDEKLLKNMKEAGCCALMIGVESANDDILKKYNKGTNVQQIKAAFNLCRKFKMQTVAYFIIGLPGEDRCSVQKTIKFAKEIKCDYASFGYATPDLGTNLREECLRNQWVENATFQNTFDPSSNPSLHTEQLSEEEARKLLRTAYRQFYLRPTFIFKKILQLKSVNEFKFFLEGGRILLKKNIL